MKAVDFEDNEGDRDHLFCEWAEGFDTVDDLRQDIEEIWEKFISRKITFLIWVCKIAQKSKLLLKIDRKVMSYLQTIYPKQWNPIVKLEGYSSLKRKKNNL
ncbi:unnamed protein product [Ilex paraguariensis]|uniref:Uncharacterized protein n=1 Tax=Ilex paraguariensis TaxID=185542 RepID=A0ABC8V500_9AQUA